MRQQSRICAGVDKEIAAVLAVHFDLGQQEAANTPHGNDGSFFRSISGEFDLAARIIDRHVKVREKRGSQNAIHHHAEQRVAQRAQRNIAHKDVPDFQRVRAVNPRLDLSFAAQSEQNVCAHFLQPEVVGDPLADDGLGGSGVDQEAIGALIIHEDLGQNEVQQSMHSDGGGLIRSFYLPRFDVAEGPGHVQGGSCHRDAVGIRGVELQIRFELACGLGGLLCDG